MQTNETIDHLKRQSREKPLSRRDFMQLLTVAGATGPGLVAAGLTGVALTRSQRAEAAELIVDGIGKLPKVPYGTRMGNMMVAPICMSQDWNSELVAPALAMGVNFIHKAGYWREIPDEIKKLPRESYYTDITVDNTSPNHDPDNYDEAYSQVTTSLEKNGLKYYDVYRAHFGWHGPENFKVENTSYKAFLKLKKEGKVKYFGVSQHPYAKVTRADGTVDFPEVRERYAEIIDAEIKSGIIDSMQVWYSYGYPKEAEDAFARASKAGIAMTAMKVYAHGHRGMSSDKSKMDALKAPDMPGRALMRYVTSLKRDDGKPIFCTTVSALHNQASFEENIGGLSTKIASIDGFDRHVYYGD